MSHAAELLDCPVVELPDCRHDAPLSHPDLFRTAIVDPLLQAGRRAPYTELQIDVYGRVEILTSEPRNVQRDVEVSPTTPGAHLVGAVLQRRALGPHAERQTSDHQDARSIFTVTFLTTNAITTISATSPTADRDTDVLGLLERHCDHGRTVPFGPQVVG